MIDVRDNWRILMLVVFCLLAALALFGPLGAEAEGADFNQTEEVVSDPTNLQYGLQLSGGTRVRGQLVGMTAEEVEFTADQRDIELTVAEELGLDPINVRVTEAETETQQGQTAGTGTGTVEVFTENATQEEFASALDTAGLDASTNQIRPGVTEQTRDQATDTIEDRINQAGLSGGSVTTISSPGSGNFIVVEVPGADRERVRELIGDPGQVQIIATVPAQTPSGNDSYIRPQILSQDDFTGISPAESGTDVQPARVPVTVNNDAAERFQNRMNELGFTTEGVGQCRWRQNPDDPGYCLLTVVDGEEVYGASMGQDLAQTMRTEQFTSNPSFLMQTDDFAEAQELELNLRAGALPTELEIQSETFLAPNLAQRFKPLALLTALIAWLAVSGVVYFWYRDVRVAIPMLVTAGSEVFLLLGFAAASGLALDLSHIAGLIAVIGTGLDDLIIMADEILQRKQQVKTGRIFQNRFRKAFWIIGMAAATTIVAMSPLAILSLGELQGFAIITIVGVLIGVLVTRPAYGDVLRQLMLDDVKRK